LLDESWRYRPDRPTVVTMHEGIPILLTILAGYESGWIVVIVCTVLAFGGAILAAILTARRVYAPSRRARSNTAVSDPALGDLGSGATVDEPGSVRVLEVLLLGTMMGYVLFDRAFAWLHVPGTPLFVGELVILVGLLVLLGMHTQLGAIARTSSSMMVVFVFMAWGTLLLVFGLPTWGEDAIRDAAMWYYGIIAVFVVVLLVSDPQRVNSWLRLFGKIIPWMLVWFPFAIILDAAFIEQFPDVPDSKVSIVAHRTGNIAVMAAVALGFLWLVDRDSTIFNRRQRTILTVLATFVLLFAAMRNRGGFVAGGVALLIAFVFLRDQRANMAGIMMGVAVVLLTVGLFGNIRVELFDGREVSIDQFLDNAASVVDPAAGGQRQQSTTRWRLAIWGQVLEDVSQDRPIAGFGPGPDLGKLYNVSGDGELPLRNPHNSHVGVLARMGIVGAALWALLWITWLVEIVSLRRRLMQRGRSSEAAVAGWLIISVVAILVNAIFDPTLEGPQVGWWLWAFLGFGIGMSVLDRWNRLPVLNLGGEAPADRPVMVTTP
jgi:O-antigen ligase